MSPPQKKCNEFTHLLKSCVSPGALQTGGLPNMEEELLIGWQEEKLHLNQEVCRLQEELAESHAEKDELESRNRALKDRVRRGRGVLLIIRRS